MTPLFTIAEIRAIERAAAQHLPEGALMQRAGQAGASEALDLLPFTVYRARVLVLAGPGNNGGDALETAAHLGHAGAQVTVLHFPPPDTPSAERIEALRRARSSPARFADFNDAADACTVAAATEWTLVVDGLLGIGLARPISGGFAALVTAVNGLACPILALDVPSGLDCDTGAIVGGVEPGVAVRATHTVTFIGDKPGLHTAEGRDHAGVVIVRDLDIERGLFPASRARLNEVALFGHCIRRRRHSSHKGSHGSVAVVGGARGMAGAPILAARTALTSGAGRVYACFVGEAPAFDAALPELMCRSAQQYDFNSAVLVIGPGMGGSAASAEMLASALHSQSAVVLDADALNLLAGSEALRKQLAQRTLPCILTPHPLEAARLLGITAAEVQSDRPAAARALAERLAATVVLKGSGTVIAARDGVIAVNTTGNPALATAGTGDVLSGLCGSLLAQGWPEWEAALAGVWLHGMAADVLVADGAGPIGLTASELIPAIRTALNRLAAHHGS
ncbi:MULTISPECIES: bifunctional ADP-dependent NAD(P)H-hydrate dehydratase/NAD(P)H-hydrate epimerase [unclassified Duganella]|uniref:bifunctional ADP-dependent NAD(P)H-hydrate dehydratase/NAD(P)H-hydrate epimerase n=1 Tax=unclassified Duganella TaxID=2636909 RepID=UPI0006F2CB21|nr:MULTISPECIES: bifunctional ADP-dependent NAD(P)H-hydrate dehydratase/NAD(P)H-hydrate epimerase [unclassified Duganella]KQV56431.1 sugar kinase [Duganella sp. Root336D2]KRB96499.1 sugar kinase [Duganella sp. Root198D2]